MKRSGRSRKPKPKARTTDQIASELSRLQAEVGRLQMQIAETRRQEPAGCAARGYHQVKKSEGRPATEDRIYARLTCQCGAEADVLLAFNESAPNRFWVSVLKERPGLEDYGEQDYDE